MTAVDKLKEALSILRAHEVEDPERDAELIVSSCLGVERVAIYRDNPVIADGINAEIDAFIERRARREPLQYILGYVEFCGLRLKVGPGVLVPRPETELLAVLAVETLRERTYSPPDPLTACPLPAGSSLTILDLCTGSGCLAVALAKEFPSAAVYGTDISAGALGYAEKNAELNSVNNAFFMKGDLFEPVEEKRFDLIVSNPPYIRAADIGSLQPEIRDWEPAEALNGGRDGLDYYRRIIPASVDHLKDCGTLMLEIGLGQSDAVGVILEASGLTNISVIKDYAGIDRIVSARKE